MAGASQQLHEARSDLDAATIDRHRAIVSIQEELEAIDWYDQRVKGATDAELREILAHNRDEEKEHAAMVIEWLRRHDAKFDEMLRTYLFSEGDIARVEEAKEAGDTAEGEGAIADGSLGIGSLKGTPDNE